MMAAPQRKDESGPSDAPALQFQTFDMPAAATPSAYVPVRPTPSSSGAAGGASGEWGAEPAPPQTPSAGFYTLDYYARFFNVTTDDVVRRMVHSVLPWKVHFLETVAPNPDLYGPFWIATTVVFVMFVVGNMARSVDAYQNGSEYTPSFTHLSVAASVVYSYVAFAPLVLWLALKYYSVRASLVELWCLYGYALAVFVPVSIVCVIPLEAVKWSCTMAALGLSGWFLAANLWPLGAQANRSVALGVAVAALLAQAGLALCFKFVFYTYYATGS